MSERFNRFADADKDEAMEGIGNNRHETSLTVDCSDGTTWTIPYGFFIPCLRGKTGSDRQEFRFTLDDESHALIIEGDGSDRFHALVLKIARQQQATLRAAGCIRKLRVVRT